MFKSQKSFRLIVIGLAIIAASSFAFAAADGSGGYDVGFRASSFEAAEAPPQGTTAPDDRVTPGTCDTAGPIEVESTLPSGPTAYATLGLAFADINAGLHTGVITIDV